MGNDKGQDDTGALLFVSFVLALSIVSLGLTVATGVAYALK